MIAYQEGVVQESTPKLATFAHLAVFVNKSTGPKGKRFNTKATIWRGTAQNKKSKNMQKQKNGDIGILSKKG